MAEHNFTKKCGSVVKTDRFMDGPKLSAGYCWEDRAPLGAGYSEFHEVVVPYDNRGLLFGYEEKEFMSKQYK